MRRVIQKAGAIWIPPATPALIVVIVIFLEELPGRQAAETVIIGDFGRQRKVRGKNFGAEAPIAADVVPAVRTVGACAIACAICR